jgi:RNA polymerase sigma-70 factor (ECF subfamily)
MYREMGLVNAQDDAGLLAQVRRGDEHAMGMVFDRYSKVVYSVALRVLRDPASAEDILHEVFLALWRSPDDFSAPQGNLGGWLALVTRNRSIDALRRKRPVPPVEDLILAAPYDVGDEAERKTLMERARSVIYRLPAEQRKTLEMAFFDGLTHAEIAEMTGDGPEMVKARIRSALMTLRRAFEA